MALHLLDYQLIANVQSGVQCWHFSWFMPVPSITLTSSLCAKLVLMIKLRSVLLSMYGFVEGALILQPLLLLIFLELRAPSKSGIVSAKFSNITACYKWSFSLCVSVWIEVFKELADHTTAVTMVNSFLSHHSFLPFSLWLTSRVVPDPASPLVLQFPVFLPFPSPTSSPTSILPLSVSVPALSSVFCLPGLNS